MVETFYLHLEFKNKKGGWSINLPFLCNKCGICCTLDDFLTAGEINAKPQEHPEVHAKVKALFEALGEIWEEDEAKYDQYITHNACPFLVDKSCSIYEIRPEGCRLFPKPRLACKPKTAKPSTDSKKNAQPLRKGRSCQRNLPFHRKSWISEV